MSKNYFFNKFNIIVWEVIGTGFVKNDKIVNFCAKFLSEKNLYPDNNLHMIYLMLQVGKPKHPSSCQQKVFLCTFDKVNLSQNNYMEGSGSATIK